MLNKPVAAMLQKMVLASLVAGFAATIFIAGCDCSGKHAPDKPKRLPELSRDAAEALFRSPGTQGIVERIRPQVLSEKNRMLKIKGLRVLSAVLLSRSHVMSRGTSLDLLICNPLGDQWNHCRRKQVQWGYVYYATRQPKMK